MLGSAIWMDTENPTVTDRPEKALHIGKPAWLKTKIPTGKVFLVRGGEVRRFDGWHDDHAVHQDQRWTVEDLGAAVEDLA